MIDTTWFGVRGVRRAEAWAAFLLLSLGACSGTEVSPPAPTGTGGSAGATASATGGGTMASGGMTTGGITTGGTATGGTTTGGTTTGGATTGGTTTGGAAGASGGGAAGNAGAAGAGGGKAGGAAGSAGTSGASGGGGKAGGAAGSAGTSGSAGNAGSGGSSGASGWMPCPATGDCRILPLGDSITDGIGFSGGYRVELFSLALAGGKSITYVGGSMNGPTMVDGETFPRAHEGHSGWTIAQIDGIVPDPALGPAPHIILLHIGTNDMSSMSAGAPDRLDTLIDQLVDELPDALLVVAQIIPLPFADNQVMTFNGAVAGLVEEHASAGEHVILVDQYEGFPESELGDGVHPDEAGYARMAGVWYEAIEPFLP